MGFGHRFNAATRAQLRQQATPSLGQMYLGQSLHTDLLRLMQEASRAAAAARAAGDMEAYRAYQTRLESLSRIYRGFGTAQDDLELEKARRGPLEQIADIGRYAAIAAAALLGFALLRALK